jgi:acetyl-CoA/propionyl-CoA carboxylase biotin carboxyl carrier protein
MLSDDRFVTGEHTTNYLDNELDDAAIEDAVERWGSDSAAASGSSTNTQTMTVEVNGRRFDVVVEDGLQRADASSGSGGGSGGGGSGGGQQAAVDGAVTAEMQGTILSVPVSVGDEVAQGDVVCVLEAMKMENDVVAPRGGTIESISIREGDSVDMGDTLIVLE